MKNCILLSLLYGMSLLLHGCSGDEALSIEGDEAGECDDGVDNDQDTATDCLDPGCEFATVCVNQGQGAQNPAGTRGAATARGGAG